MSVIWSCFLFLAVLLQAGEEASFPDRIFTAKEENKLENNPDDLEERIEVYKDASERIYKAVVKNISDRDFDALTHQLGIWLILLSESIKDIESNINLNKKIPKDLIKYEIQVRKAINDLRESKTRAPYEMQDLFEQSIDQADAIRGKIVDILFQPEKVSTEKQLK